MKVEIKKPEKKQSVLNLKNTLDKEGIHMENVYVDSKLIGCVGVASDEDRERCQKTISSALEECGGNLYQACMMLNQLGDLSEKEVSPDEEIEIKGKKYLVSYKECKLYNLKGDVVADCEDLDASAKKSMNKDVIKALLTARVK